jgi:hypothetical protein
MVGSVLTLLFLLSVTLAYAQSGGLYDLSWWTIDGGSGTLTGSGYEMMASVGQPDAGPALTGGSYTLSGGFWPGVSEDSDSYIHLPLVLSE